ncbi:unnamed protein product [Nyctereutes procyonoides]|uniref:(raccoon dog) hypothetical protein n=1 Tax=Nyctereutes procyonoides TaxID=34880 RepID=A0A811ZNX6_NYCPR|nr:unnamed protein product [Nyctereutes procyonoides]
MWRPWNPQDLPPGTASSSGSQRSKLRWLSLKKNKATMSHLNLIKACLSKLCRELITPKGGGHRLGEDFDDIGMLKYIVDFPSVEKLTLLSNLVGLSLEQQTPNIGFKKKDKGGINLTITCLQSGLNAESMNSILAEYKISNAGMALHSDATVDGLADAMEENRVYILCIYVLNKIDQISTEELGIIYKMPHCPSISDLEYWIYTKPKGQLPDYTPPAGPPYPRIMCSISI